LRGVWNVLIRMDGSLALSRIRIRPSDSRAQLGSLEFLLPSGPAGTSVWHPPKRVPMRWSRNNGSTCPAWVEREGARRWVGWAVCPRNRLCSVRGRAHFAGLPRPRDSRRTEGERPSPPQPSRHLRGPYNFVSARYSWSGRRSAVARLSTMWTPDCADAPISARLERAVK
jgi:hypothetical protein